MSWVRIWNKSFRILTVFFLAEWAKQMSNTRGHQSVPPPLPPNKTTSMAVLWIHLDPEFCPNLDPDRELCYQL